MADIPTQRLLRTKHLGHLRSAVITKLAGALVRDGNVGLKPSNVYTAIQALQQSTLHHVPTPDSETSAVDPKDH